MNRLTLLAIAALSLLLPSFAHAYEIQKTSGGKEIHWYYMPQPFLIDTHGYSGITDGSLLAAEQASFTPWEDVPMCDARYDVKTSSRGVSDIFNDSNKPGRDRNNEMAFVESDWSGRVGAGNQSGLIALTFTYFSDATGKILENDIVANAVDYTWSTDNGAVQTDVSNFLTHEVGHSYGLFHSADPEATMYATGTQGETKKRDLAQDDIDGIQHLYKPGCCKHTKTGDALALIGCDVSAGPRGNIAWIAALAALPAFVLLRRKARRGASVLAAGIALFGWGGSAQATVARDLSLQQLTAQADAVVRGHVVYDEAIANPGGSIVTITQIEVDEVVAGAAPKVVVVVQPGGKPADSDVGLIVSGTAHFAVGDEVLLFASMAAGEPGFGEAFPDAWGPVSFAQGAFRVLREPGRPARVLRDLGGMTRFAPDGTAVDGDALSGVTLDDLVSRIRRAR